MSSTPIAQLAPSLQTEQYMNAKPENRDYGYAVNLVHSICCLAGVPSHVDDLRADLRDNGVLAAVNDHDTARLFDWLMSVLSFQGIADRLAEDFIYKHGNVGWSDIELALAESPPCPKLGGHWLFNDCRYHKTSRTCTEPDHIAACPLPGHPLRNGHLNQTAYSLFLFIRDVADGDLVQWIDQQLATADAKAAMNVATARAALIGPLRNIYGVSDKVLAMALSALLMGAGNRRPLWFKVGATFIVIDTLVHNFLHRTGILQRFAASHPYGSGCYQPGGCGEILEQIAARIDASAFNPAFPKVFPRFVQSAVWRYCAEGELDICNGNRIHDAYRCDNVYCRLHAICDRIALKPKNAEKAQKIA
jgi:hypothetical protein